MKRANQGMRRNGRRARWGRFCTLAALGFRAALPAFSATTTTTDISTTPSTITFRYQIGSTLPAAQTLQVKSTGAAFTFTLAVSGAAPYYAQWLSVSAASATTPGSIKVYANPTGLPAGTHTGTITVTASGASNSPATVAVTMIVGDAAATLSASPTSLSFDSSTGVTSQTVMLSSSGGPLTASIKVSGGTWLKASPTGNIALVGVPSAVTVTVSSAGLSPGTYTAKLTFTSTTASNKTLDVTVTYIVKAGVPVISGTWPAALGIRASGTTLAPPAVTIFGTYFYGTSTAAINGTTVTTTVLSATAIQITVPNDLLTTAGSLSLTVTTPAPGGGTSNTYLLTVYPAGPHILAVANAASYDATSISPGEIIIIYGAGLGPATLSLAAATGTTLPTSWPATGSATSVTIDGNPAPILYTSDTQVSCIVPYAVASKVGSQSTVDVIVTYGGTASASKAVTLTAVHPGVFTIDASGSGQGAILNYDSTTGDYTINSASLPATKGSTIVLYVTGFGQTSPAGVETALISGTVTPVAAVSLTIDGVAATVQAAVAPVGSVPGILQINATLPSSAKTNTAAKLVVSVGGINSQTVTLVVK